MEIAPRLDDNKRALAVRAEFPGLDGRENERPTVYLDNAATTQVPRCVRDAMVTHLERDNANVHRGAHAQSARSTKRYESARAAVAAFCGAKDPSCVAFTSGTTDALNTVARGLEHRITPGDTVVVTALEHHANFVPWQELCRRTGASFNIVEVDEGGDIDAASLDRALEGTRVRVVAATGASNVTGTLTDVRALADAAHGAGALFVLDAAQLVRHGRLDVQALEADFCAFSAHKMCGPSGIGALVGAQGALDLLEPMRYGGGMVDEVGDERTTYSPAPERLEAGSPNWIGASGFAAATEALARYGIAWVAEREQAATAAVARAIEGTVGARLLGRPRRQAGCVAFEVAGLDAHDVASVLDGYGVAVRAGHHCAAPCLRRLGVKSCVRAAPAFYTTRADVEAFADALERSIAFLRKWV